ncbi:MAG: hypothetical protein ABH896_01950 [Candidatus Jacksonbacteria bacterium]
MWLITTFIIALTATLLWLLLKKKYKLGFLSLMLWGAVIMILVDHILGYEGGRFLETETDGIINSGIQLGMVMLIPVFLIWFIAILISKSKKSLEK